MAVATFIPSTQTIQAEGYTPDDELITGELFATMTELGRAELVNGKIYQMAPTAYTHAMVESRVSKLLSLHVDDKQLGYVMVGEGGMYTHREPDTVRAADVSFISHERLAQVTSPSYLDVIPELIVEVLSPHDRWRDVTEKLEEYFTAGALQVWLVEPERRLVYLYTSSTQTSILGVAETISDIPFLPGLAIPVADIFAVLPK
jgi:Uma2 family endonuclease